MKNRTNVVITRDKNYKVKDAVVVTSVEEALKELKTYGEDEIYVYRRGKHLQTTSSVL